MKPDIEYTATLIFYASSDRKAWRTLDAATAVIVELEDVCGSHLERGATGPRVKHPKAAKAK
jgi:hypothetical protein